jgi:peptide/nickel transport system substrate-binding protein
MQQCLLEANAGHWNTQRGPRLERVIFRNDLSPAEALELVCTSEGAVDLVTEVAPADAQTVSASEHAKLVGVDAMRVLVGVINRDAEGAPLHDLRARRALNLAVDRERLIQQAFAGCASPLAGLTPQSAAGVPAGQQPYPHDPEQARQLLAEARWPTGRALRLAAPGRPGGRGPAAGRQLHQLAGGGG